MDFADAAAHNEEVFRSINERIEEGANQHGVEQLLPFHCECATEACLETIELPPAEYDRIASHRARFVVVPGHEQSSVETIVESHSAYLVVEKTGEARVEIEREHHGHAIKRDRCLMCQLRKHELGFVRCAVTGDGAAEERLIEAGLAATHSRGAAGLSSEPQCELSARVCFVEQINSGPHRGDRSEELAEQLVSTDHADLGRVIGQSALATLGTPQ